MSASARNISAIETPDLQDPYSVVAGVDRTSAIDALFVNAPLRDYTRRPRVNDHTSPVLGTGYIATYAAARGHNVGVLDAEMDCLRGAGVTAFRFVDDLFLGARRVIEAMMVPFAAERVGDWARWNATGRINVLNRIEDRELDRLAANGLRQVALGVESGSTRMLEYIDKRITPGMAADVVRRLTERGIGVKGYFIVGFPTETAAEVDATEALIHRLWEMTDSLPGDFTASVFEYRPYPGTPDWHRLMATGRYTPAQLLDYSAVDLTDNGADPAMFQRDEFNFSINLQLSDAPISYLRAVLVRLMQAQHERRTAA